MHVIRFQNKMKLAASEEPLIKRIKETFPESEITEAIPKAKDMVDFKDIFTNEDDNITDESESERW